MNALPSSTRRGSALVVAIWVIGLLSLMIASFAFDAHLQLRVTSFYRKRMKAEQLARSGIEKARMLLIESARLKAETTETSEDKDKPWYGDARRLADGLNIVSSSETLGEGTLTLTIVPEPARRNVNRLTAEDWVRIFEVTGVPEELWDALIESFMDWTDTDDDARPQGAETDDYYATLDPPYRAKNAPLDTVEEILLVKGFTNSILYGGVLQEEDAAEDGEEGESGTEEQARMTGFADMLTTFGDGKVNVNAASRRVLLTLPVMDDTMADDIILEREGDPDAAEREDTSYKSTADFFSRFPDLESVLKEHISTDSQTLRITSVADVGGVGWTVSCVVSFSQDELTILRWQEQAGH